MDFFEALDAVRRKLKSLAVSSLRLALQSYTSFVRWLKDFNKWIHDQLEGDGLIKDLYEAVRVTFGF